MHKRGLFRHAVSVCVCVRVSVAFVSCVKTNKHIIKFFSLPGSHTILVFPYRRQSNIPTGTPLTGASNAGGVGRNRDSEPISGLTACVNAATGRCGKRGRRWSMASVLQVINMSCLLVINISSSSLAINTAAYYHTHVQPRVINKHRWPASPRLRDHTQLDQIDTLYMTPTKTGFRTTQNTVLGCAVVWPANMMLVCGSVHV